MTSSINSGPGLVALPDRMIRLGHQARGDCGLFGPGGARVFYDSPELGPHRDSPWLAAHVRERYGISLDRQALPGTLLNASFRAYRQFTHN